MGFHSVISIGTPSGNPFLKAQMRAGRGADACGAQGFPLAAGAQHAEDTRFGQNAPHRGPTQVDALPFLEQLGDAATDHDNTFTYGGKNYTVGEVSYVPAWTMIRFGVCPGIAGVDQTFDLYLNDQNADNADLSLSFDSDEVGTSEFRRTNDGLRHTCVEYRWQPRQVDWQKDGKVNARLIR